MEEKYEHYKETLLNDHDFIFKSNRSHSDTECKIRNRISSLNIGIKVVLPSVFVGFLGGFVKDSDSFFLKAILFLISIIAMVISYVSYQNACDKLVDDTFFYHVLPNNITRKARYFTEKKKETILSELHSATNDSISIVESIRYRKAIPKDSWDDLYKLLLRLEKLHKQYDEVSSEFDYFEKQLPDDYLFISSIKDKINK